MSRFLDPDQEIEKHGHKLPHWQQEETWVFVTWRLGDSLPQSMLNQWNAERESWFSLHPKPWSEETEAAYHQRFTTEIEAWLDAGHGSCLLQYPENARIVADALHHFDQDRYQLASYVVMPNHVHVLFSPGRDHPLSGILHSWKRHSALMINQRENRSGALWQADYWDRLIRSQDHFDWTLHYIRENPRKVPRGHFVLWSG